MAIVPAYVYQRTKFHLSRSISFGDIRGGSQNKKVGAPNFPRRPLADKFLYMALVPVNAYKCAKFQLPGSISFRDKEGVLKSNVRLLGPCGTPYAENFMCAQSTWQRQTACQVSASYLCASCSYANMYFP